MIFNSQEYMISKFPPCLRCQVKEKATNGLLLLLLLLDQDNINILVL